MVIRLEEELGIKVGLSDWDKFYQALTVFKQIKNSMKVLARFTIPAEEPWPEDLWNYRLGVRVGNLRTTGMGSSVPPSLPPSLPPSFFIYLFPPSLPPLLRSLLDGHRRRDEGGTGGHAG